MPYSFVRQAFFAFFQSHISYGILLWGHTSHVHRILILQKKAIRLLNKVDFLEHCKPLFVKDGILTVYNMYIFQCLLRVKNRQSM